MLEIYIYIYIYLNHSRNSKNFWIKEISSVSWFNIRNLSDFWRSCDTEDWSNDAENTALIRNKLYFYDTFS